jgi:hypothetical protein
MKILQYTTLQQLKEPYEHSAVHNSSADKRTVNEHSAVHNSATVKGII